MGTGRTVRLYMSPVSPSCRGTVETRAIPVTRTLTNAPAGPVSEAGKWFPPLQSPASLPRVHRDTAALCAFLSRSVHLSHGRLVRGRPRHIEPRSSNSYGGHL